MHAHQESTSKAKQESTFANGSIIKVRLITRSKLNAEETCRSDGYNEVEHWTKNDEVCHTNFSLADPQLSKSPNTMLEVSRWIHLPYCKRSQWTTRVNFKPDLCLQIVITCSFVQLRKRRICNFRHHQQQCLTKFCKLTLLIVFLVIREMIIPLFTNRIFNSCGSSYLRTFLTYVSPARKPSEQAVKSAAALPQDRVSRLGTEHLHKVDNLDR